ncbi:fumarylacetoacetate hydrolase family protein [Jiangella asiatica]|uniref:FAA hydrolase family protein n=1 Tax=Jiangella asiatica TaxID=2530372 RepID=A0A4R5DD60_9ACTN|nr:fumarylacetoacetate hydrolase family protein [Jiangella asiatica]TDE08465.1 FAA hydrolase family protein [Jiangella asiatica]
MRLATIRLPDGGTSAARVDRDRVRVLPWPDLGRLLADPNWRQLALVGETLPGEEEPQYAPLVPHPNKIVCLGLNYASHIAEMGRPTPQYPTLFAKYDGALIGAHDPVVLPAVSDAVDWEAELGVVIGAPARHVPPDHALDVVAGYTVVNDVTVRDWQHRTREFLSGKTFEATTPVGPVLVTPDELPPGASGLAITCTVDGVVMQHSTTADLLFSVARIVSYVSTIITLKPGDLIATGTPGGVGAGRSPEIWLRPGSELVTTIEGIGQLHNRCVREERPALAPASSTTR